MVQQGGVGVVLQQALQGSEDSFVLFVERSGLGVDRNKQWTDLVNESLKGDQVCVQRGGFGLITSHREAGERLVGGPQLLEHIDGRGRSRGDRLHVGICVLSVVSHFNHCCHVETLLK